MVCVRKRDGTLRLCIDCCKVDNKTVKQAEPIPKTQDTLNHLAGSHGLQYCTKEWPTTRGMCLFVYLEFMSHSRIFHSYGDVTIAGQGCKFDLCSKVMAIEQ